MAENIPEEKKFNNIIRIGLTVVIRKKRIICSKKQKCILIYL